MTCTRVLIVDDEPLARSRLRMLLSEIEPTMSVVGEVPDCEAAVDAIRRHQPDVVLLDIQLRKGSGFDLLERLGSSDPPGVVFVTAHDEYAIRAFEAGAVDYVLKPVQGERLRQAVIRAIEARALTGDNHFAELKRAIAQLQPAAPTREIQFWVRRANGDLVRIISSQIDWVAVEDNYVRIYAGENSYLVRDSIRGIAARLGTEMFMQVHRTAIVRIDAVRKVTPAPGRLLEITLHTEVKVMVGRVFAAAVKDRFRSL